MLAPHNADLNSFKNIKKGFQFAIFYGFIALKRSSVNLIKKLLWAGSCNCSGINAAVVIKIGGLGDFVFGIPALNYLRKRLPNAKIVLVTAKSLSELDFKFSGRQPVDISDLPWTDLVRDSVDDVLNVPDLSLKTILNLRSLLPKRGNKAIFILGYPGMTLSNILPKIIFARLLSKYSDSCFGVDKSLDWKFMRRFQVAHKLTKHKMLGDFDSILEGFPGDNLNLNDIDFNASITKDAVKQVCIKTGISNPQMLILMAPLATTLHKQWPVENFLQIAEHIYQKNSKCSIALIGTPDHYDVLGHVFQETLPRTINLCGQLSIAELAALLAVAKGYIGNDGGMSQLAGLVGSPSVIVFNSVEEDWLTYPWRSLKGVVRNHTDCSPCFNMLHCPEKHRRCVEDISVESVFSKVDAVMFNSQA